MRFPRYLIRVPMTFYSSKPSQTRGKNLRNRTKEKNEVSTKILSKSPIAPKKEEKKILIEEKWSWNPLFLLKKTYGTLFLGGLSILVYNLAFNGLVSERIIRYGLGINLYSPKLLGFFGFPFMHDSYGHMVSTLIPLFFSGFVLEPKIGAKNMVKIYMIGAWLGAILTYPIEVWRGTYMIYWGIGGSSASYALLAYATIMTRINPEYNETFKRTFMTAFVFNIVINIIPLMAGRMIVTSTSHIVGLIFGAAYAYLRFKKGKN